MIYLKYGTEAARSYHELDWDSKSSYEASAGTTERGYLYEKMMHARRTYQIVISADQIISGAGLDWLEQYWRGEDRKLSFDGVNWIDVIPASAGEFPKSRLENARAFPEVAFELKRIDPEAARMTGEDLF